MERGELATDLAARSDVVARQRSTGTGDHVEDRATPRFRQRFDVLPGGFSLAHKASVASAAGLDRFASRFYKKLTLFFLPSSLEAVVRHFTFRPSFTMRGRKSRGLRGWAGKPAHPPLTDVPIAAYLFAAAFDVLSVALHQGHRALATELFHAGTWILTAGAVVSVGAALTGWVDRQKSSEPGTQARRTINAHAITMVAVTVIVLVEVVLRLSVYLHASTTPVGIMIATLVAAAGVAAGATIGGSLVFDYGFNVETAGDHPAWHESEDDVLPGRKADVPHPAVIR